MSEVAPKHPINPEKQAESLEAAHEKLSTEISKNLERQSEESEKTAHTAEDVKKLEKKVEQKALTKAEITANEHEAGQQDAPIHGIAHKELKQTAYTRTLKRIQAKLPVTERVFSRVIHKPTVDMVSEALAKTVARPSGILGGGIFALAGSSLLLYISREYGFAYNYFTFFVFIAGGYLLGLGAELSIRTLKARGNK